MVAAIFMGWHDALGALDDAPDGPQTYLPQPWRLDRCYPCIRSYIQAELESLNAAGGELQNALTNPFFGAL